MRNGQTLGAVLGYQFERGLHEGHPGVELDQFIDDFRNAYPIARNEGRDRDEPAAAITARNVVDGLALRLAWRGEEGFKPIPWASIAPSDIQRSAIEDELKKLDETVDAVADFLLADSVFQLVGGKMDAAGASLKAVGEGGRPPEGDIAKVPRSGTSLIHRVALIVGGDPVDISGLGWDGPHNERARAEPYLNGWIGQVLGDPHIFRCEVHFESGVNQPITLHELTLDPLDVLALARAVEYTSEDSELDRRVRHAAGAAAPMEEPFIIRYQPAGLAGDQRSLASALEVARALNELLGAARALEPKDLIPPEQLADLESADPAIAPDVRSVELQDRAVSAKIRFDNAGEALARVLQALNAVAPDQTAANELDNVRAALKTIAKFGVPGAYPRTDTGNTPVLRETLASQAESVLREVDRRRVNVADATDPVAQLKVIFGRDFVVLPRFRPTRPAELQQALDQPPELGADPEKTMATWFAQVSRVRKPLGLWQRVRQYAGAFAPPTGERRVAQLPFAPGARWVGLAFDAEDARPSRGRVSLMLHRARTPNASELWAGLLLDEWMESIPSIDEDVGVVFHHDSPGAQAPQAVLVAVPPMSIEQWSFDLLVRLLQQTLFHAKVRGVDREHAAFLCGQLIPMIYLAQNTRNDTVSTPIVGDVIQTAYEFSTE